MVTSAGRRCANSSLPRFREDFISLFRCRSVSSSCRRTGQVGRKGERSETSLVGNGPDPIMILPFRHLGSEIDVHGAIGVHLGIGVLADRGKLLAVLQLGSAEGIVNQHRPKTIDRNLWWDTQSIVPPAIKEVAVRIPIGPQVLRAHADSR